MLPGRTVMPLPHLGNSGCLLCAQKVVSYSLGLVDFAIGLVNSVLILPDGQVMFFEEFNLQKNCKINSAHQKVLGLLEMVFWLVHASFSLPEWQAVKMTFFVPWQTWSPTPTRRQKMCIKENLYFSNPQFPETSDNSSHN